MFFINAMLACFCFSHSWVLQNAKKKLGKVPLSLSLPSRTLSDEWKMLKIQNFLTALLDDSENAKMCLARRKNLIAKWESIFSYFFSLSLSPLSLRHKKFILFSFSIACLNIYMCLLFTHLMIVWCLIYFSCWWCVGISLIFDRF